MYLRTHFLNEGTAFISLKEYQILSTNILGKLNSFLNFQIILSAIKHLGKLDS